MTQMHPLASLLARILMSAIFISSGYSKITNYAQTAGYMESHGIPGILLPLVIAVELGCGLAVLFGMLSRWAALALAAFSILAAVVFHPYWSDPAQYVHFMKNVAIAGGLLLLFANGPGKWAIRSE